VIAPRFVCGLLMAACLLGGSAAQAQPAQPASEDTTPTIVGEPQWEIEAHGGISFDKDASGGSGTLPTTGTTLQGLISLSTFFFGSGTSLFNQARPGSTITPLDAALLGPAVTRGQGPTGGVRVYRAITHRFGIEFGGDYIRSRMALRSTTLSALEASRASFVRALGATLPGATVNAVTTTTDNVDAPRVLATGALVVNLRTSGRTIPYVVVGGGMIFNNGTSPTASLDGTYQVGAPSTLYGTDSVKLSYVEDDHTPVYLGGAGIKQQLSPHFGFRIDGRVHVYKVSTISMVDVTPGQQLETTGQPPPIITLGALQFSALGPLNGVPYGSAQTFAGSGLQAQVSVTAGLFFRF
jgi:hypothetical protein